MAAMPGQKHDFSAVWRPPHRSRTTTHSRTIPRLKPIQGHGVGVYMFLLALNKPYLTTRGKQFIVRHKVPGGLPRGMNITHAGSGIIFICLTANAGHQAVPLTRIEALCGAKFMRANTGNEIRIPDRPKPQRA